MRFHAPDRRKPPLLTFLMPEFDWRWMFGIMGIAGLVGAAIWYGAYRDSSSIALTAEENLYRTEDDTTGKGERVSMAEWRRLFGCRTTWGKIMAFFGAIYLTRIFTAWLPGYRQLSSEPSL